MTARRTRDHLVLWAGVFLAVAIFYITRSYPHTPWSDGGPAAFYPRFLATVLAGLSVVSWIAGSRQAGSEAAVSRRTAATVVVALACLLIAAWFLASVGFWLTGVILSLAIMLILRSGPVSLRALTRLCAAAVGITAALKILFEYVAGQRLP